MKTLRFVIPNGSLSSKLTEYLIIAGYPISSPDRSGFCGRANDIEFYQLDRRMVPYFIETEFDAGITGYDLWLASGVTHLKSLAELGFAKKTEQPSRWVLVKKKGVTIYPSKIKIACELPKLAEILMEKVSLQKKYEIVRIDGSEEQSVVFGIADMALLVTETGTSISANGLEIVSGCENLLVSTPRIISRGDLDIIQIEKLNQLISALQSVIGAKKYVMISFDLPAKVDVNELELPSAVAPTVSPLTNPEWNAVQICISRSDFGRTAWKIKTKGAKSIIFQDLGGYLE